MKSKPNGSAVNRKLSFHIEINRHAKRINPKKKKIFLSCLVKEFPDFIHFSEAL
jgi:hypothetical protein